jgi:anhydro-N-acetylmuramic acid kinase
MIETERYRVVGLMSGTSLDGLDLAYCTFQKEQQGWHFEIIDAQTVPYDAHLRDMLSNAHKGTAAELNMIDTILGLMFSNAIIEFISELGAEIDLISSHGHTVFHDPQNHINLQIGKGSVIAATTGITTVCDFRTQDILEGGQGAPLVPIGDHLLFHDYDLCLNIGGISNISAAPTGRRIAWDICPANMVLNTLARKTGQDFDTDGIMAANGKLIPELLEKLNDLHYYHEKPPKSLSREWVEGEFLQVLEAYATQSHPDLLRTVTEHIALQISNTCNTIKQTGTMLVTGGGAKNTFLMQRLESLCNVEIAKTSPNLIDYKEALIFAFLGVLRARNEINCLASVTGARQDHCSGAIYYGQLGAALKI